MVPKGQAQRDAQQVAARLRQEYPDAECALEHKNPFQLLIATILSAQCTDERVNQVTPKLFQKYPTPREMSAAPVGRLEREIQSTGFFRNKAKNIKACSRKLMDEHGGEVPKKMEDLVELPGVGRKTANVVLGSAYGIASGVVVDTHVARLSKRIGLTTEKDPEKIERDLIAQLPREEWVDFSHRLIHHGRRICTARLAMCDRCVLLNLCPRIGVEGKTTLPPPGPVAPKKPSGARRRKPQSL